jgi:hypothetical protein
MMMIASYQTTDAQAIPIMNVVMLEIVMKGNVTVIQDSQERNVKVP